MKKFLPVGSVVKIKGLGELMTIVGRCPLLKENNVEGYYDYKAVVYPQGDMGGNDYYCFNKENIEQIVFVGYNSSIENELNDLFNEFVEKGEYPQFKLGEDDSQNMKNNTKDIRENLFN